MNSHLRKINRNMVTGWLVIVVVLLVTYSIEVVKGERTLSYMFSFVSVVVLPALCVLIQYLRRPDWKWLCYLIVPGYFIMYIFVMITGSTNMVFSYILPMLSLLVLYHHPDLILWTGVAAMIVNLFSIYQNFRAGVLNLSNSKDAEIQVALIALCFGGSYIAARLYDEITKQNEEYLQMLNKKNEQIREMTTQTITAIANALDAKDAYTEGHAERVAAYSAHIARKLGMSEEEAGNIRFVALFHDIGKIGVPDVVLNKPGRLTTDEYDKMKQHTIVGGEIIKDLDMIPGVYVGARYHHERYDGKGYPEGLKGEDIPYIARIIATADAFDAMTTNRIYRKRLTNEQALDELRKGMGTQFDSKVAGALIELISTGAMKNLSPDLAEDSEAGGR